MHPGRVRIEGGGPWTPELDAAWRLCDTSAGGDPDRTTTCKDRFKVVLTRDALTLYVNDVRYFRAELLAPELQLSGELLGGEVYAYLANWVHTAHTPLHDPSPEVVRFSWGPLRVNPHLAPMFADGFESGDTRAWAAASDPES